MEHNPIYVYKKGIDIFLRRWRASLVAEVVKNLPVKQEMRVQSLGQVDPLEKDMTAHSSIVSWEIPWTEEPGGLQSMGSQRVGHDWKTRLSLRKVPQKNVLERDFLAVQWLRFLSFHCRGQRFHLWSENWDPICCAAWPKKKCFRKDGLTANRCYKGIQGLWVGDGRDLPFYTFWSDSNYFTMC